MDRGTLAVSVFYSPQNLDFNEEFNVRPGKPRCVQRKLFETLTFCLGQNYKVYDYLTHFKRGHWLERNFAFTRLIIFKTTQVNNN